MSKVVTIPKDRNPFVVIVNGVKHSYPAGVSTEVPDEVADVIEKYEGAKPKPDPNAGINFGGSQSDWNQTDSSAADFIKNKPFGDMPTGGDTLYWDGNTEGLVSNEGIYKLSDATPSYDEATNYNLNFVSGSENIIITAEEVPVAWITEGVSYILGEGVIVFVEDSTSYGATKGVYFAKYSDDEFVSSLTIPGYTGFPVTKKMEEKYLPGAVILYADDKAYLCSDSGVSERITKTQLVNSFENGRVLVDLSAAGMPCKSTITGVIEEENYAMGLGVLPDIGVMGLYTAEYTAS
jgi:hypothetical protein